tara:strand:- start:9462 stop:12446 length:2985 start_codon:yes stop_codon:yes gene_type:complete
MQIYIRFLLTAVLLCSFPLQAANPQEVTTAPEGDWIVERRFVLPDTIPEEDIDNGVHYLLSDEQILVEEDKPTKYFQHYTEVVVNQRGLEYSSQIRVQFDPAYQELVFHKLRIIRGDQILDKLDTVNFRLLQREAELEDLIYSGKLTANAILDDVRVGDIIDYSYTIEGDNPIYDGIFSTWAFTQWGVPLEKQYFRLLWKKEDPLHVSTMNTHIEVSESLLPDAIEYAFESLNSTPAIVNSETPSWFSPYGLILFSESADWSDVVNWSVPMYRDALSDRQGVKAIADTIRASTQDREQQVVDALVYVQEEIRYMGIETGANSHRPSPAYETLERRYGDCKDKTVLLIAILDELGVKAFPALVNTNGMRPERLLPPDANAFDHVIVAVEVGGKSFWLDPTRQYQYGSIDEIPQADFGFALVVQPGSSELTEMNVDHSVSALRVHDVFDLTPGGTGTVKYSSRSEYSGDRAEHLRRQIAMSGLGDVEDSFDNFYQAYYPGTQRLTKIQIDSKPDSGTLTLSEEFEIIDFWQTDESENKFNASFYANLVSSEIAQPEQLNRESPYALTFPTNIWQTIEVKLDEGNWQFDDDNHVVDNPFFHFGYDVHYDDSTNTLFLNYQLNVKVDHVPVRDIQRYLDARDEMLKYASYSIFTYIDPALASSNHDNDSRYISQWILAVLGAYCLVILLAIVGWRLDARKEQPYDIDMFYPVSLFKLWLLTLATFGIYTSYWFYRNWKCVKAKEKSSIMPIARGIFSPFWYYPLYQKLSREHSVAGHTHQLPGKALMITMAVFYFMLGILANAVSYGMAFTLIAPLAVFPLANYINHIGEPGNSVITHHSRWRPRHYLLTAFLIPFFIFSCAVELNLLPNSKAVDGNAVWNHDLKFMQRNGIVPADEDIVMFYSDADFDIRTDGNGFTESQVFSYWVNENDDLEVRRAALEDVDDIKTRFAANWNANTTFTIVKNDGTEFVLYASAEDRKDKVFDRKLREKWRSAIDR